MSIIARSIARPLIKVVALVDTKPLIGGIYNCFYLNGDLHFWPQSEISILDVRNRLPLEKKGLTIYQRPETPMGPITAYSLAGDYIKIKLKIQQPFTNFYTSLNNL